MKKIPLNTKRKCKHKDAPLYALVDDEDYDLVKDQNWYALKFKNNKFYAATNEKQPNGKPKKELIHRKILGITDPDIHVDHINGAGWNNFRSNIRTCTQQQNNCNARKRKDNTSGYPGVYWNKRRQKWVARIGVNGKRKHLGYFDDKEEAEEVYKAACIKYFGEFANIDL